MPKPAPSSPAADLDLVCRAVAGEAQVAEVYRTDDVIAFLDHRPVFKGHVLVCPVRHATTLLDMATDEIAPLFSAVQLIAAAVQQSTDAQGTFVAMNNVVSQSVMHLHVHVVPRTKGDGLRGFFWPRVTYAGGEIEQYVQRIRAALA